MGNRTSCTCGCFAKGVLIKMSDSSSKPIEELQIGDMIITKDNGVQTIKNILTGSEKTIVEIVASNGRELKVTKDHPILSSNNAMKRADELKEGTIIVSEDGEITVQAVSEQFYDDKVYNLILEEDSVLIANEIYAGDLLTQNRLNNLSNNTRHNDYERIKKELEGIFNN